MVLELELLAAVLAEVTLFQQLEIKRRRPWCINSAHPLEILVSRASSAVIRLTPANRRQKAVLRLERGKERLSVKASHRSLSPCHSR